MKLARFLHFISSDQLCLLSTLSLVVKFKLMLNQVLISIRSIILSALFTGSVLWGNSSNPPNGYHGESQNCASCHGGNLNSGDGSISLSGLPTTYLPGQTYSLTLTVLGTNCGFGFQLSR